MIPLFHQNLLQNGEPSVNVPPEITTTELPWAFDGEAYEFELTATGSHPITWAIIDGALPDGLTLDEDTGEISGTPEETGSFNFTVEATNAYGSDSAPFTLTVTTPVTVSNDAVRDMRRRGRVMLIYGRG